MDEVTDRKKRVLIVDDEPTICQIVSLKLTISGFDTITTTSGAEAIGLVQKENPDVILLDILMPDVTGFEVLDRLRAFSSTPIVVFTARPDLAQEAVRHGANDCIAKPFNPDKLVEKIRMILNTREHTKTQDDTKA